MKNLNKNIERHYFKQGLYEDIINRLKEPDIDLNKVKRSDIAGIPTDAIPCSSAILLVFL